MSDAALFTKKAQKGTGSNAVDGVCMISKSKVTWEPSDPSKAKPAVIEISAITSEGRCRRREARKERWGGRRRYRRAVTTAPLLPAGTQQAPGKPFIKLDTAAGPLILGFQTVADRDDAVELLKSSKPAARPASTASAGDKLLVPTAAQATALFRADKDLESVYRSLVVAGILSEQEFWRTRQGQLKDALARGGGGTRSAAQRVGLPSAMLADVKPSADGQTEKVHFQLTPAVIQQVSGGLCRHLPGQGLLPVGSSVGSATCAEGPAAVRASVLRAAVSLAALNPPTALVHSRRQPVAAQQGGAHCADPFPPCRACPCRLQIFAERPEVHRAYLAHVPHSMDEKAFWTRYFKQQYKRMARRYDVETPRTRCVTVGIIYGRHVVGGGDPRGSAWAGLLALPPARPPLRSCLPLARFPPVQEAAGPAGRRRRRRRRRAVCALQAPAAAAGARVFVCVCVWGGGGGAFKRRGPCRTPSSLWGSTRRPQGGQVSGTAGKAVHA